MAGSRIFAAFPKKRKSFLCSLILHSVILFFLFSCLHNLQAQITHGGQPYDYLLKASPTIPFVVLPYVDNEAMVARDAYSWNKSGPYKFGEKTSLDLGPDMSGVWRTLKNGDRIWYLGIRSDGAYSLNLIFSEYHLAPGARLFIYNEDRSDYIGAFDHRNNKVHGKLATTLVRGEAIIIEYYEPQSVKGKSRLRVGSATHAYRDVYDRAKTFIPGFGSADPCTINIHCAQGDEWQDESRSVLMLMVNGSGLCSATLVNNTANDGTPYVLTADHCIGDSDGSNYVSLFNYESPVCKNSYPNIDQTVSGTVIRARSEDSDFALLEMSEAPPASYNALYSGWTRSTASPTRYICIGHPSGDIKKWSEETHKGREPGYWRTSPKLNSGQTEYGSSGSGVWDQNGRLVGQLYGGSGWCDDVDLINYWGRFDWSWDRGGSDSSRLKEWLDPIGSDTMYMDHFDPNASTDPGITFQLNLSEEEDLYEGGAVRLHLAEPESRVAMEDSSGNGIYLCTLNFDPGTEVKYFFSYQNGPDLEKDFVDEQDLMEGEVCVNEEGYRTLTVESRNQTLPAVFFASCLLSPFMPEITFQVDMNEVQDLYEPGGVWVSFGNWASWWVMRDDDGDGIYSATGLMEPDSKVKYFFGYQTGPDENSDYTGEKQELKGLECASAVGFRLLTVPDEDLALAPVVYASCQETISSTGTPDELGNIQVYYDTVNELVRISNAYELSAVEIFSITGQKLFGLKAHHQDRLEIRTNTLSKGVYVLRFHTDSGYWTGLTIMK